jgi:hypothetical protein
MQTMKMTESEKQGNSVLHELFDQQLPLGVSENASVRERQITKYYFREPNISVIIRTSMSALAILQYLSSLHRVAASRLTSIRLF